MDGWTARIRGSMSEPNLSYEELHDAWPLLSISDRVEGFTLLVHEESEDLFYRLNAREQAELIMALPSNRRRVWVRLLAPDDAADVIQETENEADRQALLEMMDESARKEVLALLAYAEDDAGGLMSPRFARLRPDMTVDAAVSYLRLQRPEHLETIYYAYVLDNQQKLLGVVSLRDLVCSPPKQLVREIMETDIVSVRAETDQEHLANVFAEHDLSAIPVLDDEGRMKGIVTVDDIVDVVREEATEDMQKLAAAAALDAPYFQVDLLGMLKKRSGWLAALVALEFLAVLAMRHFQDLIDKAVLLAIFVPLITSSGGNSGSQAATLIVRAMALGEMRLRDWFRVFRGEIAVGFIMGLILGAIGLTITLIGLNFLEPDAEHQFHIGVTVGCAILCIVLWGTMAGSMLPFLLRMLKFDPACASGPFIATLVDASGLIIYFSIAGFLFRETLFA